MSMSQPQAQPIQFPIRSMHRAFPFSAIVGQEEMKLALILNAVHPGVGGVLIRGEKGTAKSTTVRSLAGLLPEIEVVRGCRFGCDPEAPELFCSDCRSNGHPRERERRPVRVVDLPLNATEDMVLGGLDFTGAVRTGQRLISLGLLARANRGFVYVDEVNLLDDHLVDIVLDAAASGVNVIEREGISFRHPARIILVGSMNPEEGELRPQLLDRFGLAVEVKGEPEVGDRVELMERKEKYDHNPEGFAASFAQEEEKLAQAVVRARELLPKIRLERRVEGFISSLCLENNVAGHRADLVIREAARALAAYEGRTEVGEDLVIRVAPLALLHRRRDPLPPPPPPPPPPEEQEDQEPEEPPETPPDDQDQEEDQENDDLDEPFDLPLPEPPEPPQDQDTDDGEEEQIFEVGQTFKVKTLRQPKDRRLRRGSGRRSPTRTSQKQGRYVKADLNRENNDLALDATLRAAAPYQLRRKGSSGLQVCVHDQDIRTKVREKRIGSFLLFVVDASGSMGVRARMIATKGAILSLLLDAYQKRDKVCLVTFRKTEAQVNLPPTSSIDLAARLLKELPIGGRTPVSAGLAEAHRQLSNHLSKEPEARPIVVVITDGKANSGLGTEMEPLQEALAMAGRLGREERAKFVVVDTEPQGIVRLGLAARLARELGAEYFKIEDLKAQELVEIARRNS